ncbi:hypothetical protein [Streptomyces sp. NPDC002520]
MVGLFTYLAVVRRAPVVFALTGGSMVWESITVPDLAGREHLIDVGAAIARGLLHGRRGQVRAAVRSLLPTRKAESGPAPAPPPDFPKKPQQPRQCDPFRTSTRAGAP